ncbi:MAG TPA: SBBP repeat-containing protein, partial [Bryobacteraceae bacterium]|nr:SBBP repeat-containing protein [Bryobacteraceae bacterium]
QVRELYRGIDLVYYGNQGELEYDLTVKPGADPRTIRLRLDGTCARVDHDGNLIAGLIQKRPVAYQLAADGSRISVASRYRKNADGSYGFVLGAYDHDRALVIDPVLTFSLYLSGSNQDVAQTIGLDRIGFLWVAGTTYSTNFPNGSAFQTKQGGGTDIFVTKIDPNAKAGHQIVFSSYLGGGTNDTLGGMAVGPNGDVYLTGTTFSADFPMVNAAQTVLGGTNDAFVAWINSSRKLGYSTFLGGKGDETGLGVTFNSENEIFVTGGTDSTDFPTGAPLQSATGGRDDAYVAEYKPSLSGAATLVYSTYLGGSNFDIGRAIALAPDGTIWVTGGTYSFNFPMKGNSYDKTYGGGGDAFVAHIKPSGGSSGLLYSSFLGGSDQEEASSIVVDAQGQVIISGWTISSDYPVTSTALQTKYGGSGNGFLSILDTTKNPQLTYSTYIGGTGPTIPSDLKLDAEGNLYLTGMTLAGDLPTTANAAQPKWDGSEDAFALVLNPAGGVKYMTYLGSDGLQVGYGIAFDGKDNIYVVGYTSGPIFKALKGVTKTSAAGKVDGFVAGISIK